MNRYERNASYRLIAGRISAYMSRYATTPGKTLSRMTCKQSFRTKWYTDISGIPTEADPQPNTPHLSLVLTNEQLPGALVSLLVYLRVDNYIRHANLLGRLLREATGGRKQKLRYLEFRQIGPATMNERRTATEHLTFSSTHIGYYYCMLEI